MDRGEIVRISEKSGAGRAPNGIANSKNRSAGRIALYVPGNDEFPDKSFFPLALPTRRAEK